MPCQQNQPTDWHQQGHFVVRGPAPARKVFYDTFSDTAYSARSEFVRNHNLLWSKAEAAGYTVAQFDQVGEMAPTTVGRSAAAGSQS